MSEAVAAGVGAVDTTAESTERKRIADAAVQFEAMFLLQMLKQMRQSMLQDEEVEPGLGAGTMFDTIDAELARHLAQQGTGLAGVIERGLTKQAGTGDSSSGTRSSSTPASTIVPAAISLAPSVAEPLPATRAGTVSEGVTLSDPLAATGTPATTTSAFGWRTDPFTGRAKFHGGVDLRAAYGTAVSAAAAGEVVFAGEQGGYGRSVVVEHAPGIQTRYAHLSEIDVRAGDTVSAGAVVGRVGKSGRATGPHLHFEVVDQGRRVDPASAARRLASALKLQNSAADYPTGSAGAAGGASGDDE